MLPCKLSSSALRPDRIWCSRNASKPCHYCRSVPSSKAELDMFDRRLRRNLARHSQCSQGLSMRTQLGTQSCPCEHSGCQHMYLVDLHLGHVCSAFVRMLRCYGLLGNMLVKVAGQSACRNSVPLSRTWPDVCGWLCLRPYLFSHLHVEYMPAKEMLQASCVTF